MSFESLISGYGLVMPSRPVRYALLTIFALGVGLVFASCGGQSHEAWKTQVAAVCNDQELARSLREVEAMQAGSMGDQAFTRKREQAFAESIKAFAARVRAIDRPSDEGVEMAFVNALNAEIADIDELIAALGEPNSAHARQLIAAQDLTRLPNATRDAGLPRSCLWTPQF